jgi:hypothetical protein
MSKKVLLQQNEVEYRHFASPRKPKITGKTRHSDKTAPDENCPLWEKDAPPGRTRFGQRGQF